MLLSLAVHQHLLRCLQCEGNPLLFGMLYRMGLVEQIGSGIRRISQECRDYGLAEPVIDVSENRVTTTFVRQLTHPGDQDTPQVPRKSRSQSSALSVNIRVRKSFRVWG